MEENSYCHERLFAEGCWGEDWETILRHLPEGWEARAYESGAMRRVRGFGNPEALLRTLLVHLAEGCSLRETAARARQGGLAAVSDVAIMKRLQKAEEWLRWMACELTRCHEVAVLPERKTPLRIRITDATTVSEPGSTGTDWRLHYSLELKTLRCDFFDITDVHGGETYERIPVKPGDLILGDRIYESSEGIGHVLRHGGDVLVRMRIKGMPLQTPEGGRFELLPRLRTLRVGEIGDWPVQVAADSDPPIQGRVCAIRRSRTAAALAQKRLRRRCSRKGREPQAAGLEATRYVFVFTTVQASLLDRSEVMELFRGRWQIEIAFKRLKSVMGFGHLPKKDERSCRAWLHGKLFVALLADHMANEARLFSPWGYELSTPQAATRLC